MKIVIRADASAEMGGGHVVRCRSLAEALVARGWAASFAVRVENLKTVRQLAGGLEVMPLSGPAHAEHDELMRLLPDGCDLLLVDHYARGLDFERACRSWAKITVAIDDFPDRPHDCDLLLDQTAGRHADDYAVQLPAGTPVLTGSMFALLRRQFARARWELAGPGGFKAPRSSGPFRILVALGATDPGNLTRTVLHALDHVDGEIAIDAVLSAGAPHLDSVRATIAGSRHDARLHVDVAEMATMMVDADLAVGAAGSSAWERCCLGLPTLAIQTAGNQRDILAGLVEAGAAAVAGPDDSSVAAAAKALIGDLSRLGLMRRAALALCDGLGAERLAVWLGPPVFARDGRRVSLLPVEDADAATLLAWQHDPGTRRHARVSDIPNETEHMAWFALRRADPGCVLNMVNHGDTRAGIVRLDRRTDRDGFEVSIVTAPEKRGIGIARAALALVRELLPETHLLAYISSANEASLSLFAASGYRPLGEDWYENRPAGDAPRT